MGTYLRWALIRGWALNRIRTYLFTTFSVGSTFSKSISDQTAWASRIPGFRQLQHTTSWRKFILIMPWYSGLPKPVDPFTPRSSHGKMTLPSIFEAFLTCVNLRAKSYEVTILIKPLRQNFLKVYWSLRIYKKIFRVFGMILIWPVLEVKGLTTVTVNTVADLNVVGHNWHISEVQGSIDFIHDVQRCRLVVMESKYLNKRAKM